MPSPHSFVAMDLARASFVCSVGIILPLFPFRWGETLNVVAMSLEENYAFCSPMSSVAVVVASLC